jgi:hypothetical protein
MAMSWLSGCDSPRHLSMNWQIGSPSTSRARFCTYSQLSVEQAQAV